MTTPTTNVPFPTFTPTGFVPPSEAAIMAGVIADFQAAFGGNLNTALNTPQGQWISSMTAIIGNCFNLFCYYASQCDPAYAIGRMQDAIGRIYFISRLPALPTLVSCTCIGAAGTVIPQGSLASDTAGNLYYSTAQGIIASSGNTTIVFANQQTGAIPCAEGTLVNIYQAIPGWDAIFNPANGVLGQVVESQSAFELRRQNTVEGNSLGAIGSIIGAVANVPGVIDYFGYDNGSAAPVSVLGQSIPANSIYICVAGGTQAAVAQAIFSKKAPGCAYTGNTVVTAYDNNPLYPAPIAYTVKYQTPNPLPIYFNVNLVNSVNVPSNAATLVQNAIINAFAGDDVGIPRARIGTLILSSWYYGAISQLGSWAQVRSMQIGSMNVTGATFNGSINGTMMSVGTLTSGTIAVGQVVSVGSASGTAYGTVSEGAQVLLQVSGTVGGTGIYTLGLSSTVKVTNLVSVNVNQNTVQVQANQIPVVSAPDITVTVT